VAYLPEAADFCSAYETETGVPLRQLISEVLREDPRPPSQRKKKEMFGVRLYNINVRWQVSGNSCLVRSCAKVG
jgi:hypothetical protein